MRIAKFFLALILTIVISSYLSAVSMCLVALAVTPKAMSGHGLLDIVGNVLFSVPAMGAVIAAPICALLSVVLAIGMILADRFKVFGPQIGRVMAASIAGALPGLAFGRIAGSSACRVGSVLQNPSCDIGMWVGMLSFALTGALAGMIFGVVYKTKKNSGEQNAPDA